MSIFKLPDLGEGLPDAEISEWHVKEGDVVKTDDLLVSMETAKAVVDVPSPQSGKIAKLYGKAGDIIKTGEPLVEFVGAEESTMTAKSPGESKQDAFGAVAGSIEVGDTVIEESPTGVASTVGQATQAIKAMPAVRSLAKQLNVDLTTVTATGPNGQITADDVKKASTIAPAATTSPSVAIPSMTAASVEPLRGVRRAMANAMAESHKHVVPVTLVDDADIHAWPKGTDITLRVLRALVAACQTEPALNSSFDFQKLERHLYKEVNIGIAMDSKDGLFVPVIKDAANKTSKELRETINRFKQEVKDRKINPAELKDSTIQLSNFGVFAGRYANPIVVPPNVAILGTGRIHDEVVPHNSEVAIHRILPLSLTIDHRAVTGGEAARFLAAVIEDLQTAD